MFKKVRTNSIFESKPDVLVSGRVLGTYLGEDHKLTRRIQAATPLIVSEVYLPEDIPLTKRQEKLVKRAWEAAAAQPEETIDRAHVQHKLGILVVAEDSFTPTTVDSNVQILDEDELVAGKISIDAFIGDESKAA